MVFGTATTSGNSMIAFCDAGSIKADMHLEKLTVVQTESGVVMPAVTMELPTATFKSSENPMYGANRACEAGSITSQSTSAVIWEDFSQTNTSDSYEVQQVENQRRCFEMKTIPAEAPAGDSISLPTQPDGVFNRSLDAVCSSSFMKEPDSAIRTHCNGFIEARGVPGKYMKRRRGGRVFTRTHHPAAAYQQSEMRKGMRNERYPVALYQPYPHLKQGFSKNRMSSTRNDFSRQSVVGSLSAPSNRGQQAVLTHALLSQLETVNGATSSTEIVQKARAEDNFGGGADRCEHATATEEQGMCTNQDDAFMWAVKQKVELARGMSHEKTARERVEEQMERSRQCDKQGTSLLTNYENSERNTSSCNSICGIVNKKNWRGHVNMCDNVSDMWHGLKTQDGKPVVILPQNGRFMNSLPRLGAAPHLFHCSNRHGFRYTGMPNRKQLQERKWKSKKLSTDRRGNNYCTEGLHITNERLSRKVWKPNKWKHPLRKHEMGRVQTAKPAEANLYNRGSLQPFEALEAPFRDHARSIPTRVVYYDSVLPSASTTSHGEWKTFTEGAATGSLEAFKPHKNCAVRVSEVTRFDSATTELAATPAPKGRLPQRYRHRRAIRRRAMAAAAGKVFAHPTTSTDTAVAQGPDLAHYVASNRWEVQPTFVPPSNKGKRAFDPKHKRKPRATRGRVNSGKASSLWQANSYFALQGADTSAPNNVTLGVAGSHIGTEENEMLSSRRPLISYHDLEYEAITVGSSVMAGGVSAANHQPLAKGSDLGGRVHPVAEKQDHAKSATREHVQRLLAASRGVPIPNQALV